MTQQTFFTPYAEPSRALTLSLGDWYDSYRGRPASDCPARRDWAINLSTTPWLLSGVEECDRHGLALFDAGLRACADVVEHDDNAKDYLAFAAGLRASLEASALAHWLLDPALLPLDRLTRLANLTLEDLHEEKENMRSLVTRAGWSGNSLPWREPYDEKTAEVIDTLRTLRLDEPVLVPGEAPFFGDRSTISTRIVTLFTAPGGVGKKAKEREKQRGRAAYKLLSAPAHASLSTIKRLYEPVLISDDVGRKRSQPAHMSVGEMLSTAGEALIAVHEAVGARLGWETDPYFRVCLDAIEEVMLKRR